MVKIHSQKDKRIWNSFRLRQLPRAELKIPHGLEHWNLRMATLKNAFARQKQAITAPGLALLTLRYQLKREGCLFVSVFFSRRFFRPRASTPTFLPNPPWLYRKINNAALFSARKACTDTARGCVCARHAHTRALHWVATIFSIRIKICSQRHSRLRPSPTFD